MELKICWSIGGGGVRRERPLPLRSTTAYGKSVMYYALMNDFLKARPVVKDTNIW